jgi:hypothetical protein
VDSQLPRGPKGSKRSSGCFCRNYAGFAEAKNMPENPNPDTPGRIDPTALTLEDAARLLTRAGGEPITVDMLLADRDAGAPANGDGTLNLIHYAAWLVKEMGRGD